MQHFLTISSWTDIFNTDFFAKVIVEVILLGIGIHLFKLSTENKFKLSYQKKENFINKKIDIYIEVVSVLTRYLSADTWTNDKVSTNPKFKRTLDNMPLESELNSCVFKLGLYSENKEIAKTFIKLINKSNNNENTINLLTKLINLMRQDLGYGQSIFDELEDNFKYLRIVQPFNNVI